MKVAIYTRVSTEDQKENGFSLADQERKLRLHCKSLGKEVLKHYQDNCSAKDFNRPQFQKLLIDLKSGNLKISELWCLRTDRFSRDFFKSYEMIARLASLGVSLRFMENEVDTSIPENLLLDVIQKVLPQIENERRGLNTRMGMRQAMREGRWVWKAPKGYSNNPETKIIEPNEDARLILMAFQDVSKNLRPIDHIRKELILEGFKCSKQMFYNLLRNPIYTGKIRINPTRDEPEELVDGKHIAIVPESLFRQVQKILNGNSVKRSKQKNSDSIFPLRGHLICNTCGNNLTASSSKGRKQYYKYYHCQNGCKERHRSEEVESTFVKLLDSLEIPGQVARLYYRVVKDVFESQDGKREDQIRAKEKVLAKLKGNLQRIDDQLILGSLLIEDYNRIATNIKESGQKLKDEINALNTDQSDLDVYFDRSLFLLMHLKEHYLKAPINIKRQIVGSIFPEKLIYTGKNYRTGKLNTVVDLIAGKNWGSQRVGNKKAAITGDLSNLAPPLGLEPRTL